METEIGGLPGQTRITAAQMHPRPRPLKAEITVRNLSGVPPFVQIQRSLASQERPSAFPMVIKMSSALDDRYRSACRACVWDVRLCRARPANSDLPTAWPEGSGVSRYDTPCEGEIADSARKHKARDRFDDDDIRHAVVHATYAADDGEDPHKALYLGPDRAARFLRCAASRRCR
jgi:hypothetical protein